MLTLLYLRQARDTFLLYKEQRQKYRNGFWDYHMFLFTRPLHEHSNFSRETIDNCLPASNHVCYYKNKISHYSLVKVCFLLYIYICMYVCMYVCMYISDSPFVF